MKKGLIYLILISFFYVSNISLYNSYYPILNFNSASALTITEGKKQELIDLCLAEDESKSEEQCEAEFEAKTQEFNETVVAVDESIHGTTTSEDWALFIGTLIDLVGYIKAFVAKPDNFLRPSMDLGLIAAGIICFWYFGSLVMFSDYSTQMEIAINADVKKFNETTIDKGTAATMEVGYTTQIDALKKARESIDNFRNALITASVFAFLASVMAIVECIGCAKGVTVWCHSTPVKNTNPIFKIFNFLNFNSASAQDQIELGQGKEIPENVNNENANESTEGEISLGLKESSRDDGAGMDVNSWISTIGKLFMIISVGKDAGFLKTVLVKIAKNAGEKIGITLLCLLRFAFFLWDGTNYLITESYWEDTEKEIDRRIVILEKLLAVLRSQFQDNPENNVGVNGNANQNVTANNSDNPLSDFNLGDGNLGGVCIDGDINTGESSFKNSNEECSESNIEVDKESIRELAKKTEGIIPEITGFTEDTIKDIESIERGINTTEPIGVNSKEITANAKKLIPKLLRIKRKIEKDRGIPKSSSVLDNFFKVQRLKTQQRQDFAKALSNAGVSIPKSLASLRKLNKNKNSSQEKTSRKVKDDKKFNPLRTYKLGDVKLKRRTKKSTNSLRSDALQKYKIKHDDINKKKGVSIWKLLNNRYLKSGYPRLFDQD